MIPDIRKESQTHTEPGRGWPWKLGLVLLIFYVGVLALYFVGRFGLNWIDGDTARISENISAVYRSGRLVSSSGVYTNGYGFPALSVFIAQLAGVSIQTLQTQVYPFFIFLIAVVAFVVYRELGGSNTVALLSALFVFLQSDFLFVIFRGSHEKVTWTLVLLALYFLVKGFKSSEDQWSVTLTWTLLLYLVIFALIATNVFFATSLIQALAFCFVTIILLSRLPFLRKAAANLPIYSLRRLLYVVVSSSILVFFIIVYAYPPALAFIRTLGSLGEQVSLLFLSSGVESEVRESANIFRTVWVNRQVYFLVSSFNYVVVIVAGITWSISTIHFLRNGDSNKTVDPAIMLLWILFPAFTVQLFFSLFGSQASVAGSNLHLRLFTPTSLVGIPIAVMGILALMNRIRGQRSRKMFSFSLAALIALFSILSVVKMTSEPFFNTRWIAYEEAEIFAGEWILDHVKDNAVWTGIDGRAQNSLNFRLDQTKASSVEFDGFGFDANTTHFLFSNLERIRYLQLGEPLPDFQNEQQVYDSGEVRGYFRRPKSEFQK